MRIWDGGGELTGNVLWEVQNAAVIFEVDRVLGDFVYFNQTCLKEKIQHTHTNTHTYIYIYIYIGA